MSLRLFVTLAASLALTACAPLPAPLADSPDRSPSAAQVRADPEAFAMAMVRWGGEIVRVENGATVTRVEVRAQPLTRSGRPIPSDRDLGRFVAEVPEFLDPALYAPGRELTVAGTIQGTESRAIGSYDYVYPTVHTTGYTLWPRRVERDVIYMYEPVFNSIRLERMRSPLAFPRPPIMEPVPMMER